MSSRRDEEMVNDKPLCGVKPLHKTCFMLDDLGNLQSEGHGIPGLETMLLAGLGQKQQFTLILQSHQQAR